MEVKANPHADPGILRERLKGAVVNRMGFLDQWDVAALAGSEGTRLFQVLVRCGGCRFVCAAQDVAHLLSCIKAGGDYVRDVSIPAAKCEEIKNAVSLGAW